MSTFGRRMSRPAERTRRYLSDLCALETLEPRRLLSAGSLSWRDLAPVTAHTNVMIQSRPAGQTPASFSVPSGALTPLQIRKAYGVGAITLPNVSSADGAGQTIAIIDAYGDPNALSDLMAFDAQFGLPDPPSFRQLNQTGGTSLPGTDPAARHSSNTWELEESLDIQWAHAIAPGANIILFAANSNSTSDLFAAVNTAKSTPGVSVVSMSFSTSEFSGQTALDSTFTSNAGQGVTFFAATGDSGTPAGYPATSPNVIGVGGTTLSTNTSGNYLGETAWSGSGGSLSSVESQPSYQQGVVTQSSTWRAAPDVAMDAAPSSGVAVFDSFDGARGGGNWFTVGGTSLATPMWAGLMAIVNQGRVANGLATYDGRTGTLPRLYALPSSDFHDITSGSNGLPAGAGYDLVTGRGTPIASLLVADLANIPLPAWIAAGSAATWDSSTKVLTVTGSATMTANPGTDLPNITIDSGGTLTLSSGLAGSVVLSSLSVNGTGKLDLNNNTIFVKYTGGASPIATLTSLIKTGRNGGTWNGAGIDSSAAALNTSYGLGINDDPANQQVKVMYTLLGDTNLDAAVDVADLGTLLNNYGQAGRTWADGEFSYNATGMVDVGDLGLLLNNYGQTAALAAVTPLALTQAAPAPLALSQTAGQTLMGGATNDTLYRSSADDVLYPVAMWHSRPAR